MAAKHVHGAEPKNGSSFSHMRGERNAMSHVTCKAGVGSVPFAHVAIDHSYSQQPVPRGFSLFKRCEWLVVNCNVGKRTPLPMSHSVRTKKID